ncbi:hypothetical protein [Roseomonas mucosa]
MTGCDEDDPEDTIVPPWATRRSCPYLPAAAPDPARLLLLLLPLTQAEDLLRDRLGVDRSSQIHRMVSGSRESRCRR